MLVTWFLSLFEMKQTLWLKPIAIEALDHKFCDWKDLFTLFFLISMIIPSPVVFPILQNVCEIKGKFMWLPSMIVSSCSLFFIYSKHSICIEFVCLVLKYKHIIFFCVNQTWANQIWIKTLKCVLNEKHWSFLNLPFAQICFLLSVSPQSSHLFRFVHLPHNSHTQKKIKKDISIFNSLQSIMNI